MLRSVVSLPIFLLLLSLDRKEGLLYRCLRLIHGGQKVLYKKGDDFPLPLSLRFCRQPFACVLYSTVIQEKVL